MFSRIFYKTLARFSSLETTLIRGKDIRKINLTPLQKA